MASAEELREINDELNALEWGYSEPLNPLCPRCGVVTLNPCSSDEAAICPNITEGAEPWQALKS